MTVAIRTEHLSKDFTIGRGYGYDTLREQLATALKAPFRRGSAAPDERRLVHALSDLSVTIDQGEVVGILGSNGAGKSTLLKVLSRISEPTTGSAEIHGRVGSLLEVGTGFHPELSGRENIYLNGAILGMRQAEIRRQFDAIVEFSEIERFLDTPVKRYSSGMTVRLAFSVAAHLQTEVLIVDEVLAVGDAAFQRKCLGRMSDVASEGRTVLFVSHNMAVIQALCERGILLEHGRLVRDGSVEETVADYLGRLEQLGGVPLLERRDRRGWNNILVSNLEVSSRDGATLATGQPACFTVTLTGLQQSTTCSLTLVNNLGQPVARLDSGNVGPQDEVVPVTDAARPATFTCEVDSLPLLPGRYRVDVRVKGTHSVEDQLEAAAMFDVEPGLLDGRPVAMSGEGSVALLHRWSVPAL